MNKVNRKQLVAARHAQYWAAHFWPAIHDRTPALSRAVLDQLSPVAVARAWEPGQRFPVIFQHGVMMAVVPEQTELVEEHLVVRGYDDSGRAGFIVIQPTGLLALSRSPNAQQAVADSNRTTAQSSRVEASMIAVGAIDKARKIAASQATA